VLLYAQNENRWKAPFFQALAPGPYTDADGPSHKGTRGNQRSWSADHNVVCPAPRVRWKLILMQVPFDLASRLSSAALLSGRSPEDLLREAINHLIESAAPAADLLGEMQQLHSGFVPQPQSFSVYE
jgi:hypothetical protein